MLLKISLVIGIISTISICALKPKMHNRIMIYNSDYKIIEQNVNKTEEKNVPVAELKVETKKIKTQVESKPLTQPKTQKSEMTTVKLTKTNAVKPVTTIQNTKKEQKISSETQETIEWNIWRSNLQNQIMKDVKLPILPKGIVFKFEFDVDKFGKVSNVQTWSLTPAYTPYAIQYIAPVIRSYQGHSILNFPANSNRTQTHVAGGWKIAESVKYSSPKDYNDVEKVVK